MEEVIKYAGCFVCGDCNPNGLNARFFFDGTEVTTEIVADKRFEGYSGICHGGITAALLDEVMVKAVLATGIFSTTAEMTVRYHRPVRVGERVICRGRITQHKGRAYFTEASAVNGEGQALASATGKYIEARDEFRDQLMKPSD